MAAKKGLDGRMRDHSGQIRHKRRDTLVQTLRTEYGAHFAAEFKPRDTLGKVLDKTGSTSLHDYLKNHKHHK
jgi:hypothetical protein